MAARQAPGRAALDGAVGTLAVVVTGGAALLLGRVVEGWVGCVVVGWVVVGWVVVGCVVVGWVVVDCVVVVVAVVVVVVVSEDDALVLDDEDDGGGGGAGTTVVVSCPSVPWVTVVMGAAGEGPIEYVVLVSVTGVESLDVLVRVTARPPAASSAAAAAAPNRMGGRLYQARGSGPRSGRSSSGANATSGRAPVAPVG
jgi:hypothetical protein